MQEERNAAVMVLPQAPALWLSGGCLKVKLLSQPSHCWSSQVGRGRVFLVAFKGDAIPAIFQARPHDVVNSSCYCCFDSWDDSSLDWNTLKLGFSSTSPWRFHFLAGRARSWPLGQPRVECWQQGLCGRLARFKPWRREPLPHEVDWKYCGSMSSADGCCRPESCFEAGSWALSQAKRFVGLSCDNDAWMLTRVLSSKLIITICLLACFQKWLELTGLTLTHVASCQGVRFVPVL